VLGDADAAPEAAVDGATLGAAWDAGDDDAAGVQAAKTKTAAAVSAKTRLLSMDSSCPCASPHRARAFLEPAINVAEPEEYVLREAAVTFEAIETPPIGPQPSARIAACHGITRRSTATTTR
jgi:predicted TPR repeat methyltransferase